MGGDNIKEFNQNEILVCTGGFEGDINRAGEFGITVVPAGVRLAEVPSDANVANSEWADSCVAERDRLSRARDA